MKKLMIAFVALAALASFSVVALGNTFTGSFGKVIVDSRCDSHVQLGATGINFNSGDSKVTAHFLLNNQLLPTSALPHPEQAEFTVVNGTTYLFDFPTTDGTNTYQVNLRWTDGKGTQHLFLVKNTDGKAFAFTTTTCPTSLPAPPPNRLAPPISNPGPPPVVSNPPPITNPPPPVASLPAPPALVKPPVKHKVARKFLPRPDHPLAWPKPRHMTQRLVQYAKCTHGRTSFGPVHQVARVVSPLPRNKWKRAPGGYIVKVIYDTFGTDCTQPVTG